MADEKIVTSIVANSDFSNLIADVQRVTTSLFKMQQQFAGANRLMQRTQCSKRQCSRLGSSLHTLLA
jgi:hypothetical protein